MTPGTRLDVTIEKPAAGGRMIARHEGAVLLVAGAIPGERVEVTVERVQKHTVWARVTRVHEASPDRLGDAERAPCGGHVFAHIAPARQAVLKGEIVADAFARLARLPLPGPVPVSTAAVGGYRMRARLQVAHGAVGFFREGSHAICDAVATGQLGEGAAALVAVLADAVRTADPGLRAVEVSETLAGDARALHLDGPAEPPAAVADALHVPGVRGVSWSADEAARSRTVWGEPWVADTFAVRGTAVTLRRHARSFFQGNRHLLVPLVEHVLEAVAAGPVIDLYAGVGLFSVAAAACGMGPVLAVEGDRSSFGDLRDNAQALADSLAVLHAPVERALAGGLRQPEVVVLDPPRTGATPQALAGVIALAPARVVYVSCDVATLARDAKGLAAAGYGLRRIHAFDLFPQTAHVECVAVFAR